MIVSAISQGMLWAILGLGIFMTYRILDFPDMTTEGSFPLGAAVCVTAITHGSADCSYIIRRRCWHDSRTRYGVTLYKRKDTGYFSRDFSDVRIELSYFVCDANTKSFFIESSDSTRQLPSLWVT